MPGEPQPQPRAVAGVSTGAFDEAAVQGAAAISRHITAHAGFGDSASGTGSPARIHALGESGFDDSAATTAAAHVRHLISSGRQFEAAAVAAPSHPSSAPSRTEGGDHLLEILSKPKPAYTNEARSLRIEGEIELEAWFGAAGQIRVVRIIHGLGHGLDESAAEAACGIRFRPATRQGRAVDTLARVRIEFQMAY